MVDAKSRMHDVADGIPLTASGKRPQQIRAGQRASHLLVADDREIVLKARHDFLGGDGERFIGR